MRWVRDQTGRFPQRPHYDGQELDDECEVLVDAFLQAKYGSVNYPISTNDLIILLEREMQELDLYADLDEEGERVEGVTDFFLGKKPRVRITRELSEQAWRENRLRTTLSHELGHVKFHNFLWSLDQSRSRMFGDRGNMFSQRCKRETILGARKTDWMEWQAGYASGAFLMPVTPLKQIIVDLLKETSLVTPVSIHIPAGEELIRRVQDGFRVSSDAARVRLLQLGYLTKEAVSQPLFIPVNSWLFLSHVIR